MERSGRPWQSFATQKALEVQHRREEYLAFVAHDLRTPLNAISLSARVLELLLTRDRSETPRDDTDAQDPNRNVQHLQDLIGKVLEENTNLETEVGVKLERRRFDLWPLVEAAHSRSPPGRRDGLDAPDQRESPRTSSSTPMPACCGGSSRT